MFEFFFKYPQQDYARGELIFVAHWPIWLLTTLVIVAVAGISLLLFRRRGHATTIQLATVWFLQVAMLALVLGLLLQPTLRTEQLKAGENAVALVVDASESMSYGVAQSRFNQAMESLAAVADTNTFELTPLHYTLAETADRVDSFVDVLPTGTTTSIPDSLLAVVDQARSQSLAAVVLSSDGIDTTGGVSSEQLAELAGLGVPVHTIAVGRDVIPEDLELAQLLVPEKALPSSTVAARVAIRHDRAGEATIKVYDGDALLATEPVQLPPNVTTTTAWINIDLHAAGYHRLHFEIDGDADEPELRNNSRSALVKVEEQQFRVLYFEGEPRWEYKFMRRALGSEGDIKLMSLLRVSPNKYYRQGLEFPEQLEQGFPATRDELFAYDALIIGSIEAASFSDAQMQTIADFVSERGGSLLMLAGPNGLGDGGWGQSAIADVLPARLPPTGSDSFVRQKASVLLTPQGADMQMLRLADSTADNQQMWSNLPEIADYQTIGELKPAAMRLLSLKTEADTRPLLITQPYGRGHAYILASGGTWRWQMSAPLEDQSHEMFWRQLLRAMVASAPSSIALSADSAAAESSVRLRAEFRDDAFRPMNDLRVAAVVSHEDGDSWTLDLTPSVDDAGVFVADAALDQSGTWFFEAIAEREGEVIESARTSFYSESGQAEHFDIRRNSALLRRISEATGGRYFEAGDLGALPDLLRYSDAGITEQVLRPVWDAIAVFLLLFLLKSAEWLLRRRWSTI